MTSSTIGAYLPADSAHPLSHRETVSYELIEAVRHSFQVGTFKLGNMDRSEPYRPQNLQFTKTLPELEADLFDRCSKLYSNGRAKAAAGDFSSSCRLFASARVMCDRSPMGPGSRTLSLARLSAAEAYLDYCCGDFEAAILRLRCAVQHYSDLSRIVFEPVIAMAQLHLVISSIRVQYLAHGPVAALDVARRCILFFEGHKANLPEIDHMPEPATIPLQARIYGARRVIDELALLTASIPSSDHESCLPFFADELLGTGGPCIPAEVLAWFAFKTTIGSEDYSSLFQSAAKNTLRRSFPQAPRLMVRDSAGTLRTYARTSPAHRRCERRFWGQLHRGAYFRVSKPPEF